MSESCANLDLKHRKLGGSDFSENEHGNNEYDTVGELVSIPTKYLVDICFWHVVHKSHEQIGQNVAHM